TRIGKPFEVSAVLEQGRGLTVAQKRVFNAERFDSVLHALRPGGVGLVADQHLAHGLAQLVAQEEAAAAGPAGGLADSGGAHAAYAALPVDVHELPGFASQGERAQTGPFTTVFEHVCEEGGV